MKTQLQLKIDNKTKPPGSLGRLEEIALQIGLIQNTLSPEIKNPTMLVFAADHGIADEKVSPYPKEVTWQMVMNFVSGGAAINVFCKQNRISLKVIDAGVDFDFPTDLPIVNAKIANGTRNMLHQPAMTIEECQAAIDKGREFILKEVQHGCNAIGFGEMGIGNTSPSSLLMHRFLNLPIEECTGAGAGMVGDKLDYKTSVLKSVSQKHNPKTPLETLAAFGGLEIAMMTGAFLEAYKQGMIILVDGFIATSSLLTACQFEPSVKDNAVFCHTSNEKGHKTLLEHFNANPVLDLGMRLGEGTGAAVALPVIQSALAFLNEMASFEDAGVAKE
ncbi:nicotinate-nucleotide--dimethylbenzimidazole phosphoribosyltransferase [Natronoflexus pectinivorans]|uniref:Nicotinate-nucleotide--dimethylbenzimidazole phosphoribosyltransferase n=1 Tax=Natronoflexus pectinivorans TaxID=682526 RepID=A0A4R2GHX9_9BACT|nr:nicotinate-nucleotide--dimethylbenzimidazole phosphoribosyltransferase [Natronoflexus pectinivorans]TCO08045.1 nicotinate-nucleotide-dimethylbenzimidazole phosphoribosyltransferase [Natronoflexus pectinivorans]